MLLGFGTGSYGRLGSRSCEDLVEPSVIAGDLEGREITSISGGLYHSAAVTRDSSVVLFGSNATGCLADGQDNQSPKRIQSLTPRIEIVQVAVSGDFAGAHTLAVSRQGRLYAWGLAKACGLGQLDTDIVSVPTLVTKFSRTDFSNPDREVFSTERIVMAAAGGCCSAVITADGHVYTFGITSGGRLGLPRTKHLSVQWIPKRVDALMGETAVAVSAGGAHMLCATDRGNLYAWGDNGQGQLGCGDLTDRFKPVRVLHPKRAAWSPILAAGESHSLAVDVGGKLYAFGGSGGPMLGQGKSDMASARTGERERALCISFKIEDVRHAYTRPHLVGVLADSRVVKVAAGARHSVSVTADGTVFAWGSRTQLGIGGTVNQWAVPRVVGVTGTVTALACGAYHSLIAVKPGETPVTQFLIESMSRPKPGLSHDCSVLTCEGKNVWLCSAFLKSRISGSAWRSFFRPQISLVETASAIVDVEDVSLSRVADEMKFSLNESDVSESQNVAEEYDRIGKIFDDWVATGDGEIPAPSIPDDCLFNKLKTAEVISWVTLVITGELPYLPENGSVDSESRLAVLLRLSICAQFQRGVSLVRQRMQLIESPDEVVAGISASDLGGDMNSLFLRAATVDQPTDVMVQFKCGAAMYRETLADSDTVCAHKFVVEAFCASIGVADGSPGKRRSPWVLQADGTVDCTNVPVDVMRELVYHWYHQRLNESEIGAEMDFSQLMDDGNSKAVEFWVEVATVAKLVGTETAAAAALDRLVDRLNEESWKAILHASSAIPGNRQVKEAALVVGEKLLVKQILKSEPFTRASGYIFTDAEIPPVVEKFLAAELTEHEQDLLRDRVIETIKGSCAVSRFIKAQLEHYQTLNEDPLAGKSSGQEAVPWMRKLAKSANLSLRGGPSMVAAGRDLAIALVVAAVAGILYTTPFEMGRIGIFMGRNSLVAKGIVVVVNFALLTVALLWFYKTGKRSPKTSNS